MITEILPTCPKRSKATDETYVGELRSEGFEFRALCEQISQTLFIIEYTGMSEAFVLARVRGSVLTSDGTGPTSTLG